MHEPFEPDLSLWDAWSPRDVANRLRGVATPWYVAGGWAIDLFLGGCYREHDDLEIAVPRDGFREVAQRLDGFELFVVGAPSMGLLTALDPAGDALETTRQIWVREPDTGLWRLDVMREPADGNLWQCRRDARLRLPYDQVIEHTDDGIPFGRPEIVMLFKAKHARQKDDADFRAVLPSLEPQRRRWLAEALALVHPGHRWLTELRG